MLFDREQMRGLFDLAMDEAEQQLFYAIKTVPEDRASLLAQLDALYTVRDRINARIDYPNPIAS